MAEAKTEIDKIASLKASEPLATKEYELTSFPFFFTYKPKINLTTQNPKALVIKGDL